jgi:hypothetical protein
MWRFLKKSKSMMFQPISVDDICPTISYDFKCTYYKGTPHIDILIIAFHGDYRDGSTGSADAGLIRGILKIGAEAFNPYSILIDFTDLKYEWGDNLDLSFEDAAPITTVVLVGNKCRKAMSTLAFGIDTDREIVDNVFFFDDFDKAIAKLKQQRS